MMKNKVYFEEQIKKSKRLTEEEAKNLKNLNAVAGDRVLYYIFHHREKNGLITVSLKKILERDLDKLNNHIFLKMDNSIPRFTISLFGENCYEGIKID